MKVKNTRLREKDIHHGLVAYLAEPGFEIRKVMFHDKVRPSRVKYAYGNFDVKLSPITKEILANADDIEELSVKHGEEAIRLSFKEIDELKKNLIKTSAGTSTVNMSLVVDPGQLVLMHVFQAELLFEESQVGLFRKEKQATEYLSKVKKKEGLEVLHDFLEL